MRNRARLAFAGAFMVALVAVLGFAAFSPRQPTEGVATTSVIETEMPASVSGRVAGAIFATEFAQDVTETTSTASDG